MFKKSLEIDQEHYESTKEVLINNGSKVSEHVMGSRKTLLADNQVCGYSKVDYSLQISKDLPSNKFHSFLGSFTKSLYSQIRNNDSLLDLKIEFEDISRDKNHNQYKKLRQREIFYNVDLSSAYWQMAYRLGYISKKIFNAYIFRDEYKEAKRYCISFLARENEMNYFDGREINNIKCETSALYQIYQNVRNELYNVIDQVKKETKNRWIEYNIDGITISSKDLGIVCEKFNELNLIFKVNECMKLDNFEYIYKNKIKKF
jgi:hypothetical protein